MANTKASVLRGEKISGQLGGDGYDQFMELVRKFVALKHAFLASTPTAQRYFLREIEKARAADAVSLGNEIATVSLVVAEGAVK